MKHNGSIAIWKFIYCLMIIALHLGVLEAFRDTDIRFSGGSIGVEFFFLVSGFLLGKKALDVKDYDDLGIENRKYLFKRIKKLMGMTLIVFAFSYFFFTSINKYAIFNRVNFIWDILLLRNAGYEYRTLIYVGWFTSVLVFVSLVLYPLVLKYKNKFLYILGPIIIFCAASFLAYNWKGSLAWDGEYYFKCLLRGIFEMTLGVCLVPLADKIKKMDFTKSGIILISLIEIIGFSSILFIVNTESSHQKYDYVMLLILAVCVALAFSEKTISTHILSKQIIFYLEKLSFPMYLSQGLIISVFANYINLENYSYYTILGLVFLADILFSILCMLIYNKSQKYLIKARRLIINEEKCK